MSNYFYRNLYDFQIEAAGNQGVVFKTHPNINKELFNNENVLGLKDPQRPFPTGQSGDGVSLLKWRMQTVDEAVVPLTSEFAAYKVFYFLPCDQILIMVPTAIYFS